MSLTKKQIELIQIITTGNVDGGHVDLDQLIERASHKPSKQSIHFSIRALIGKELVEKLPKEKRRGRVRVIIAPTDWGNIMRGRGFSGGLSIP